MHAKICPKITMGQNGTYQNSGGGEIKTCNLAYAANSAEKLQKGLGFCLFASFRL